jgi:predicted nucleotidyltransferase
MELTSSPFEASRSAVADELGPDGQVWLFGSRVDDEERGGDLDLHIESDGTPEILERELRLYARLQAELGERRIDLVTRSRSRSPGTIDRGAKRTGVRL